LPSYFAGNRALRCIVRIKEFLDLVLLKEADGLLRLRALGCLGNGFVKRGLSHPGWRGLASQVILSRRDRQAQIQDQRRNRESFNEALHQFAGSVAPACWLAKANPSPWNHLPVVPALDDASR
jgi:hypothetical protein